MVLSDNRSMSTVLDINLMPYPVRCAISTGYGACEFIKIEGEIMKPAEDDFFYEATMRICGSLDLDIMMSDCHAFIRNVIPADGLAMNIYDLEAKTMESFSLVVDPEFDLGKINLQLTPEAIAHLKKIETADLEQSHFIVNRPQEDPVGKLAWEALGKKEISYLVSLLKVGSKKLGMVGLLARGYDRYTERDFKLFNQLSGPFAIAMSNALKHREIMRLQELLADDNRYLKRQIHKMTGDEIIGKDFGLRNVMEMVMQVAPLASQVLLLGETGVGKEVIANTIHHSSPRAGGPFIKVNCGAIPESLVDSELFGHEKGAFTGAVKQKRGRFERAHGGTIFLDEIGELPLEVQVRLLRVIQMREIERVGGTDPVSVDIRIIAATHRDLPEMIRGGRFREDLWFRLNVFPITIPPLRHRRMDIPAMVSFFIKKKSREMNFQAEKKPGPGSMERLQAYYWPGNVRELENVVERALIRSSANLQGKYLCFDELNLSSRQTAASPPISPDTSPVLNMDEAMKSHIYSVLNLTKGKIQGEDGAAALLGLPPSTLRNRMKKLGVTW